MKTMTCNDLDGACNMEFHAETFDEMAKLSQQHGSEMKEKADQPHLDAMQKMMELMQEPEAMQKWMGEKKEIFDNLSED